jgi:transcriptional regulator with XRE-family HTH domain
MPAHDGSHGEPREDLEAFLRDLRALRAREGLSIAELAARTHFSLDTIAAAADGPVRPTLPVLEAYVRGCGDSLEAWMDRWQAVAPATGSAETMRQRAITGSTSQPEFTITRLGPRPAPWRLIRLVATGMAVVALASGGALLLSRPAGHATPSAAASRPPGSGNSAARGTAPLPVPAQTPASPRPSATRTPAQHSAPPVAAWPEIAGVGCPNSQRDGVNLDAASRGPGWTAEGGGWTGNGCDGSAVWTMDPNGNQASPSALTWFFDPGAGVSDCTLAIFVPTQNALGMGDYAIYNGTRNLGAVSVDQAASAGQWVRLGSYPATGTSLEIQFVPAIATLTASGPGPKGNGPGRPARAGHLAPGHNAAVAASAASANCAR